MDVRHEIGLAVRIAALPALGVLGVVSAVRDSAARIRVRDDEDAADRAVAWDRLAPDDLALVLDWKYGR
ncbi:MAG: hypothetical protein LCI03_07975 [Actinobacteria bacterium]|jgi:hypothetical protein|nr:hypothetical protein [Actinomycetota bacterium]